MNEIILNGITMPTEEFITRLTELCIFCMTLSLFVLWFSRQVVCAFVEIVIYLKNYIKRKKKKKNFRPTGFEYRVERRDDDGLIYCNNELILACNNFENAVLIKAILEEDDLYVVYGKGKKHGTY